MEKDRVSARKPPKVKEDLKSFKEEIIHEMHVISENVIDQVKLVAEGVSNVNEKLERFRGEIKADVENRFGTLALAITNVTLVQNRFFTTESQRAQRNIF